MSVTEIRATSATGGQKGVKEARFDLIPVPALTELAVLYGRGAAKYAERNMELGYPLSRAYAAMMRHATQWWNGEDHDPEMGTSHLAAVAWHAFTLMTIMSTHPQMDDRVTLPGIANQPPTYTPAAAAPSEHVEDVTVEPDARAVARMATALSTAVNRAGGGADIDLSETSRLLLKLGAVPPAAA